MTVAPRFTPCTSGWVEDTKLLQSRIGVVMKPSSGLPETLGNLRRFKNYESTLARRTVKDELRENLMCKLERREPLFPGIVGYEDTVVPQMVNALLSRHNFILL